MHTKLSGARISTDAPLQYQQAASQLLHITSAPLQGCRPMMKN
jgi:hypothetical protein